MSLNLGPILYMALGIYLLAGLIVGVLAFVTGAWFVRRHAQHLRDRRVARPEVTACRGAPSRAATLHPAGHAW